jgi:hypothetical protein
MIHPLDELSDAPDRREGAARGLFWLVNQRYGRLMLLSPRKTNLVLKTNMLHPGEPEFATIPGLTCRGKISPARVSAARGGSAATLVAKRKTLRFAVTARELSVTYELWSSRIFRSLTEYESE